MTAAPEPARVLPLRRPPIRRSTVVASDRAHTFEVFVATIGTWWPVDPISAGGERVRDVTFEQRAGGRVFETWDDGTTVDWGEVRTWEPPSRFVMSWLVTGTPTEVELTFTEFGAARTLVAVEHRGWEALSDAELTADCAAPGGYAGGAFTRGWATILGSLAAALGGSPSPDPADPTETP
jgi:hypothetical protein